jgi:hypothetical protein
VTTSRSPDSAFERAQHALDILKAWARERVRDKQPVTLVTRDRVCLRFVWFDGRWRRYRHVCCDPLRDRTDHECADEGEVLGAITACTGVIPSR